VDLGKARTLFEEQQLQLAGRPAVSLPGHQAASTATSIQGHAIGSAGLKLLWVPEVPIVKMWPETKLAIGHISITQHVAAEALTAAMRHVLEETNMLQLNLFNLAGEENRMRALEREHEKWRNPLIELVVAGFKKQRAHFSLVAGTEKSLRTGKMVVLFSLFFYVTLCSEQAC
jgi:hypothetical protein